MTLLRGRKRCRSHDTLPSPSISVSSERFTWFLVLAMLAVATPSASGQSSYTQGASLPLFQLSSQDNPERAVESNGNTRRIRKRITSPGRQSNQSPQQDGESSHHSRILRGKKEPRHDIFVIHPPPSNSAKSPKQKATKDVSPNQPDNNPFAYLFEVPSTATDSTVATTTSAIPDDTSVHSLPASSSHETTSVDRHWQSFSTVTLPFSFEDLFGTQSASDATSTTDALPSSPTTHATISTLAPATSKGKGFAVAKGVKGKGLTIAKGKGATLSKGKGGSISKGKGRIGKGSFTSNSKKLDTKQSKSRSKVQKPTQVPQPSTAPKSRPPTSPSTNLPSPSATPQPTTIEPSTVEPTTIAPTTIAPTTLVPREDPTQQPSTRSPTSVNTQSPTSDVAPTETPTLLPPTTNDPTASPLPPQTTPTMSPTKLPTNSPSVSQTPTVVPSESPTISPKDLPTSSPMSSPVTTSPSTSPSEQPSTTFRPTTAPVPTRTQGPTLSPTGFPTASPTESSAPTAPTFDFSAGFDCNDQLFESLNRDRPDADYPRLIPIDASDPDTLCFLRLTPDDEQFLGTSAFLPVPIQDPDNFQFSMTIGYRIYGEERGSADGMVFVMHQDSRGSKAIGNQGGGIGVYGDFADTIKPAISIEWDTFENPGRLDIGQNNVHAVQVNPDATLVELGQTNRVPIRTDESGQVIGRMWIEYNCGNNGLINIWNNNMGFEFRPTFPVLSIPIDLSKFFFQDGRDNVVYVGYTSSIGGQADNHDVFGWEFAENCGAGDTTIF